jgi:hypothetical protein
MQYTGPAARLKGESFVSRKSVYRIDGSVTKSGKRHRSERHSSALGPSGSGTCDEGNVKKRRFSVGQPTNSRDIAPSSCNVHHQIFSETQGTEMPILPRVRRVAEAYSERGWRLRLTSLVNDYNLYRCSGALDTLAKTLMLRKSTKCRIS